MKVTVRIEVQDGERSAKVNVAVDAASGYGKDPVIGAVDKALTLVPGVLAKVVK